MNERTPHGGFYLMRRAGPVTALLVLVSVYVGKLLQSGAAGWPSLDLEHFPQLGEMLAWYAVGTAGAALFCAPAIALLAGRFRDRPAEVQPWLAAAGAWRLWLAGLIYAFGTAVGAVLLLFPGLFLSVAWVLYAPATVLDGAGPIQALRSSLQRARRDWARLVALIAGPYIVYGIVYAVGLAPQLIAGVHYEMGIVMAGGAVSTAGLQRFMSGYVAPRWFRWGLMPVLFAGARLYLFSAVVAAWYALSEQ